MHKAKGFDCERSAGPFLVLPLRPPWSKGFTGNTNVAREVVNDAFGECELLVSSKPSEGVSLATILIAIAASV